MNRKLFRCVRMRFNSLALEAMQGLLPALRRGQIQRDLLRRQLQPNYA